MPGDTLCDRSAKQTRERERERETERERGRGDVNVSWDVDSTRCSPRFANSLADHDRWHVSVELSKYLARSPAGMLIRAIVRAAVIPLFLLTPWNLNVSNQKRAAVATTCRDSPTTDGKQEEISNRYIKRVSGRQPITTDASNTV